METHEQKALGLYVVLSYDVGDFVEMCGEEESAEALQTLYLMLTTPNKKQSMENRTLNDLGAKLLRGILDRRKIPLPEPVEDIDKVAVRGEN